MGTKYLAWLRIYSVTESFREGRVGFFFKGVAPDKKRQPCSHGGPQTQESMEVLTELSRLKKSGSAKLGGCGIRVDLGRERGGG